MKAKRAFRRRKIKRIGRGDRSETRTFPRENSRDPYFHSDRWRVEKKRKRKEAQEAKRRNR